MAAYKCALSLQDSTLSALVLKMGKKEWIIQNGTSIVLHDNEEERLKPSLKSACKNLKLS